MELFKKLIDTARILNNPETGCPWDIKQNFETLQKFILEEACELIDAVDQNDDKEIIEELGDVLYVVIFYCIIAEKEGRFTVSDVIEAERKKLISRHPHVFGEEKARDIEDVKRIWNQAKRKEKSHRTSLFDGVPKSLSALARTQKILSKLIDHEYEELKRIKGQEVFSQDQLGESLLGLVFQAENLGLDAEKSLRKALDQLEKQVKDQEKNRV